MVCCLESTVILSCSYSPRRFEFVYVLVLAESRYFRHYAHWYRLHGAQSSPQTSSAFCLNSFSRKILTNQLPLEQPLLYNT